MKRKPVLILFLILYLAAGIAATGYCSAEKSRHIQSAKQDSPAVFTIAETPEEDHSDETTVPEENVVPDAELSEEPDSAVEPQETIPEDTADVSGETESSSTSYKVLSSVTIHSGPSDSDPAIGTLPAGDTGIVLGREGNWIFVQSGELEGYVYQSFLEITD